IAYMSVVWVVSDKVSGLEPRASQFMALNTVSLGCSRSRHTRAGPPRGGRPGSCRHTRKAAWGRGGCMKIVVAPDWLKGTVDAAVAAERFAARWRAQRPADEIVLRPRADGGEGTLAVLAAAIPDAHWIDTGPVTGPEGGPTPGGYLRLADGTACVEL